MAVGVRHRQATAHSVIYIITIIIIIMGLKSVFASEDVTGDLYMNFSLLASVVTFYSDFTLAILPIVFIEILELRKKTTVSLYP